MREKSYAEHRIGVLEARLAAAGISTREGASGETVVGMARVLFSNFLTGARCSVNNFGGRGELRGNLARVADFVEGNDPTAFDRLRSWQRTNLASFGPAVTALEGKDSAAAGILRKFLGGELRQNWTVIPSEVNENGQIAMDWEYAGTHDAPEGWQPEAASEHE